VAGASIGYVVVVGLMGAGLQIALDQYPSLSRYVQWLGAAYLLYLALRIGTAVPSGVRGAEGAPPAVQPIWRGMWSGFLTQTLNPKGWLVSMSGVGMFVAGAPDEALYLWLFSGISLVICFAAVSVWAALGVLIKDWLRDALHERWFNRLCALGLALCVLPMVGIG
jgi:threonine/homoserine/homoserine lactone efflux protein